MESRTETVPEQLEVLLWLSVTVSVTPLDPRLMQVNEVGLSVIEDTEQLSVEPLFTAVAVVEPFPPAFRKTVTFWHTAIGRIVSPTVTTELQLDEFPLLSVTVIVTLFAPKFAQLNVVGLMIVEAMVQLSVDPLFTCEAIILAVPNPLS